jgi:hypothetical protein
MSRISKKRVHGFRQRSARKLDAVCITDFVERVALAARVVAETSVFVVWLRRMRRLKDVAVVTESEVLLALPGW